MTKFQNLPQSVFKLMIWGNTLKGAEVYPLGRCEETVVQEKFEEHLHNVMHRDGEVNDYVF